MNGQDSIISQATAPDPVLGIVNQCVHTPADVIPIVPGRNLLIKHPDGIRSVLISRSYTKETGPDIYFRVNVADGILTASPERHRRERLD